MSSGSGRFISKVTGMLIASKISSNKSIMLDWNIRRADAVTVNIDTCPSPEHHEHRKIAHKVLWDSPTDNVPRVDKGMCQTGCRACQLSPDPLWTSGYRDLQREPSRFICLATKAVLLGGGRRRRHSRLGWMIADGELEPASPRTFVRWQQLHYIYIFEHRWKSRPVGELPTM